MTRQEIIIGLRTRAKHTHESVAKLVGLHRNSIINCESKRSIKLHTLLVVARALGATRKELAELAFAWLRDEADYCGGLPITSADIATFEKSHDVSGLVSFGDALAALKAGRRVAREGWNGKGMFLFLLPAGRVPKSAIHDPALRKVMDEQVPGDSFDALGSIRMFTADKKVLTGWLASQTDMLSNDWIVLK